MVNGWVNKKDELPPESFFNADYELETRRFVAMVDGQPEMCYRVKNKWYVIGLPSDVEPRTTFWLLIP